MAIETHIKDSGGVWRKAKEWHVKDSGGVWRKAKEVWVNNAGTWRKIFTGQAIGADWPRSATIFDAALSPTNAIANIRFFDNGTFDVNEGGTVTSYDWLTNPAAGAGDAYWFKYSYTGDLPNTILNITTSYSQMATEFKLGNEIYTDGYDSNSSNVTIFIATDNVGTGAVSGSFTISATVEV